MTNEKAIMILLRLQEPEAWEPKINGEVFEALQMAIEALSRKQADSRLYIKVHADHSPQEKAEKPYQICTEYAKGSKQIMARIGRWKQVKIGYMSPGGTPTYACGACGGSEHLHGAEYPKKKVICDNCGRINVYPWERVSEQTSSLWEDDDEIH